MRYVGSAFDDAEVNFSFDHDCFDHDYFANVLLETAAGKEHELLVRDRVQSEAVQSTSLQKAVLQDAVYNSVHY